jgi:uncharacterized protein (TIGR02271 family)
LDGSETQVLVRLDSGQLVQIPARELVLREDGTYYLGWSLADLEARWGEDQTRTLGSNGGTKQSEATIRPVAGEATNVSNRTLESGAVETVVPVIAEELNVEKRKVETGGVRIHKQVHTREEVVDQPLIREEVQVERVPINRVVEGPLPIRHEGETMIIPVLEEVLVVEKRLMLKEEVRITRRATETRQPQRVTLRAEEAVVEPLQAGPERVPAAGTDLARG